MVLLEGFHLVSRLFWGADIPLSSSDQSPRSDPRALDAILPIV